MSNFASNADGQINVDLSSVGRTNRVYSEEEEAYIRNILLASRKQKEEVVDLIGRCEVALAPHKKLPPDVLRSIFHFCHEPPVVFPLFELDLRLLHITHVCSTWRRLALETPALWSDMRILLYQPRHLQVLPFAGQWFARAQDMPRSLFIDLGCQWLDAYESPRLHEVWEQILKFMASYRLRGLELKYPINRFTLKLPDHAWTSIERLHLIGNDTANSSAISLFSDFGSLSNLKDFKISEASNLRGLDNVNQWHQLRTLDIRQRTFSHSEIPPSSCLNILRQCQSLEYCSLPLAKEPSFLSTVASRDKEQKIVLANMDHLCLKFSDGSAVSAFLQLFAIPNITTFILEISSFEKTQILNCDIPALFGIIQRSAGMSQIRRLEIDTSPLLDIGILLELLPSLERISIQSGHLTDNAIEQLSSGKLGPRLYHLCSALTHDAVEKIISMVESRYQNAKAKVPNGEQIKSQPCPFKCISIPCTGVTLNSMSYRRRIQVLFLMCSADVWLGEDWEEEGSEEEDMEEEYYEDEYGEDDEEYDEYDEYGEYGDMYF